MKLIVGLGNPGTEYEKTRHNIGFMAVDKICEKLNISLNEKKFNGIFYRNKDFILAKPLTYMNKSGDFVQALMQYYDISVEDLIVVYDDMDLLIGKAVIRQKGSSGGHNGIKDIIEKLKTENIKRLKVGIGRGDNAINFVLGKFSIADYQIIDKILDGVADALVSCIYNDVRFVMNKFNGSF
ncbi:peptidyl-tRNA hydrolase [Metamycoplasma arthritidis]|uniref:Peptidyl-tRNA hydrolase n=1 Tax=Metamycoplasma arthritidis (strain 158L3-1) TaxID=243272 RepID=PTH_META1|nr:aminoacyl-tRNA hydrolase [Metamycoplasma arthritidis]B3PNH1.1 RecName: Full=Peptidyl-tRNA hydrolase; Short=PTH [Metamycoplasma arthritidis 158L3-1]ACF07573.1 peptidyl-tRNA hydrolase [Metamycoplasma arthritidis 158L3-1]VEU79081.1 peptidyl-tRNA hydrolase [Metamycoplasma arthritidis]